jgi:hypothetical protein
VKNNNLGCLAFLFGLRQDSTANSRASQPKGSPSEEGNFHSGPGGYEGMGYSGGYAAEYRADQSYLDDGYEEES